MDEKQSQLKPGNFVPAETLPKHEYITMIERLATNPDVDVAKLEKMMDLQERILNRDAEQSFNIDMVACQSEIRAVSAKHNNDQTKSKFAKLEDIIREIKPIYTNHGFALSFYQGDTEKKDHIRIMVDIMHRDSHTKTRFVDMAVDNTGAKGAPTKTVIHGEGSSITYGRRYLTCMVFNIPTEDDDGNGAGGTETVTEDQIKALSELITEIYGKDRSGILSAMGVETLSELPAKDFKKHFQGLRQLKSKRDTK